jgi:hypothetical protein
MRGARRPSIAAGSAGAERAIAEGQKRQLADAEATYKARRAAAVAGSPAGAAVGDDKVRKARSSAAASEAPHSAPTTGGFSPARAEAERRFAKLTHGGAGAASQQPHKGSPLDILKKLHTEGWSALAPHEKTRLVGGGVGLIGAHRLVTGRDLLTGDKNND